MQEIVSSLKWLTNVKIKLFQCPRDEKSILNSKKLKLRIRRGKEFKRNT